MGPGNDWVGGGGGQGGSGGPGCGWVGVVGFQRVVGVP